MSALPIIKSPGAALRKRSGWEDALRGLAFGLMGAPWSWGRTDCHAFALRALDAMTGADTYGRIRGRYHDEATALETYHEFGDVSRHLDAFGLYEVPEHAFGDLVIFSSVRAPSFPWPGTVPAVSMSKGLVMMPTGRKPILQLAPARAIGQILKVMRVCRAQ